MDTETIKRIEQLASCGYVDIEGSIQNKPPGGTPTAVLPDGVSIHSLEQFLPNPVRFQGTFITNSRKAFLAYCADHADGATAVFINAAGMDARAIIDLGDTADPLWCKHRAALHLEERPVYTALLNMQTTNLKQNAFALWLEDWMPYITPLDRDGEEMNFTSALAAIRKVDIKTARDIGSEVHDFGAKRSALEQVEVSSKLELPAGFDFRFSPYKDFDVREFPCRLRAHITGDDVTFAIRIVGIEDIREAIAEEFLHRLENAEALKSVSVHIGTFTKS